MGKNVEREIRARFGCEVAIKIAMAACLPKSASVAATARVLDWGESEYRVIAHIPSAANGRIAFSLTSKVNGEVCRLSAKALENALNESGLDGESICYRWD